MRPGVNEDGPLSTRCSSVVIPKAVALRGRKEEMDTMGFQKIKTGHLSGTTSYFDPWGLALRDDANAASPTRLRLISPPLQRRDLNDIVGSQSSIVLRTTECSRQSRHDDTKINN